jgi:hypothetical protein
MLKVRKRKNSNMEAKILRFLVLNEVKNRQSSLAEEHCHYIRPTGNSMSTVTFKACVVENNSCINTTIWEATSKYENKGS